MRCPKCGSEKVRTLRGNKYLCEYCYYAFYACPVCGETFAYAWQLSSHMRKHRREKRGEREEVRALLEEVAAGQRLVLAKLDQVLEKLDRVLEMLSAKPAPAPPAAEPLGEASPDFLRGNPWLSLLKSRGSEVARGEG